MGKPGKPTASSTMKLAKLNGQAEIFFSIQGEGKNLGQPSIFIRSSLCNLHCVWCDTDYTWNWEGTKFLHKKSANPGYSKFKKSENIVEMQVAEIAEIVRSFDCRNLVLTGGEPLLQQDDWAELMAYLRKIDHRYRFEVETNGTLVPNPSFENWVNQYNVSPKLENSNNPAKIREKMDAYSFFSKNAKSVFKFVISAEKDLAEVLDLVKKYAIEPEKIYLMPEGTTGAELKNKEIWLVEMCKKYGFNYTSRLHILIYGDKRGV